MDSLLKILPSAATIVAVVIVMLVVQRLQARGRKADDHSFRNQLIMLALGLVGVLLVILVAPVGDATRGQLLALMGLLLSATIALSSTTILGNAVAGLMLRAVRGFRIGDFIRAGDHFGRVSERGLFHTEIQNEDRELTTLPNLFLVTHPMTTIRSSGTIVSAQVSLGYDVPRARVKELLLEAAGRIELQDPFVQILELGDFSITYRVAGLLAEIKQLLTTRSRLRGAVIDALHEGGVEIVSPTFMNQRPLGPERRFIPARSRDARADEPSSTPEAVVFDKAEEAESLEGLRANHARLVEESRTVAQEAEKEQDDAARIRLESRAAALALHRERLERIIAEREARAAKGD